MKKYIFIIAFIALGFQLKAQQPVTFSVQADEDEWQLYMSSKLMGDLRIGGKIVFITLTAGDDGNGANTFNNSSQPFYIAREKGSVYTSKFAADITGSIPLLEPALQRVTVNNKSIVKYVYRSTVSYFLRLPDGGNNGNGYSGTGRNSLRKLYEGRITNLKSIDGVTTYNSWSDLTNTIKQIILDEKGTNSQVWMNTSCLNSSTNPNETSDRFYSATAAQNAVSTLLWVGINEFITAYSQNLAPNLNNSDHADASALFSLSVWGMVQYKYSGYYTNTNKAVLPMEYFSVKRIPTGSAPTSASNNAISSVSNLQNQLPTTAASSTVPAKSTEDGLIQLPMAISVTSPVTVGSTINMRLSQYETGTLVTTIYNMSGNQVFQRTTKVTAKGLQVVSFTNPALTAGVYFVKNVLNNKYQETRKIIVK
jgi:hypothetical protein